MSKHLVPWKRSVKGYKMGCQKVKHRFGPIKAGITCLLSLSPTPFILRVPPGSCRGWTLAHFILGGSKITADGDCNHEIKRHLLLGRKVVTNLDSVWKCRHYFADKGSSSQSYGFSSSHVQNGDLDHKEGLALKNWCFWPVVLRGLLRVPGTARRSNQSILKEISPEYSLEGLMLKLKLQYFGHLMWRTDLLGKTLMQGKMEGKRTGQQSRRGLDSITNPMEMNLSKLKKTMKDKESWCAAAHGVANSWTQLSNWTCCYI